MGYYDGEALPLWQYARRFTLADHFFHAAFGGSMLNHFWLVCACTPTYPNPPASLVTSWDFSRDAGGNSNGYTMHDGEVTADGFVVNNLPSANFHRAGTPPERMVPVQSAPHIGDRLDAAGVSWAWYSGGWSDAVAGNPSRLFSFVTHPFAYFADVAPGTEAAARHLKSEEDFFADLAAGFLPNVVFLKPEDNEHPGDSALLSGDEHAANLIRAIEGSPYWERSVIVVTYDENGGFWDHVAPPVGDRWGPGTRVPAIIVSPFARRGHVDHTVYDTTSILRFIEWRWNLAPLGDRDANANNLKTALDFSIPS